MGIHRMQIWKPKCKVEQGGAGDRFGWANKVWQPSQSYEINHKYEKEIPRVIFCLRQETAKK